MVALRWVRDAVEYPQHKKATDVIREGHAFLTKTFDKEPKVPDKDMSVAQSSEFPKYCDLDLFRVCDREDWPPRHAEERTDRGVRHFIYAGNSRMTEQEQKLELGGFLSKDSEVRKEVKSVVSLRWADMVDDDESLSDDDIAPDVDRALADLYLY